jgi:hypothetical protein
MAANKNRCSGASGKIKILKYLLALFRDANIKRFYRTMHFYTLMLC